MIVPAKDSLFAKDKKIHRKRLFLLQNALRVMYRTKK